MRAVTCSSSRPLPALFSSTCVSHRRLSSPSSSPGSAPSAAPAGNCVGPNQEVGESGRGWRGWGRWGGGRAVMCYLAHCWLCSASSARGRWELGSLMRGLKVRLSAAGNIGIQCILDEGRSTGRRTGGRWGC